jgi:regulator of sirC expression with transglutaminase-like and TPR domain
VSRVALALALCLALAGCKRPDKHRPGPLTAGLLALGREAAAERLAPMPVDKQILGQLESLAREVRAELESAHPVDALNTVVLKRRGFRREVKDLSLESVLLSRVLARRQGSCMGLGALYLALGERLGLELCAVLVPGHLFLRYRGPGGVRGVELLKGGRQMPEAWYRGRYPVPAGNPLYLKTCLNTSQTLAVYRYNLANALRERGRHRGAVEHYRAVVKQLPAFAEAHANLGLTLQRLGRLEEARRAYLRARTHNPRLPGLERNLEALRQQRGRSED